MDRERQEILNNTKDEGRIRTKRKRFINEWSANVATRYKSSAQREPYIDDSIGDEWREIEEKLAHRVAKVMIIYKFNWSFIF